MGLISILPMLVPVESGEKVSLSVTVLLSQIFELFVLSEILPPSTDEDFPIIGSLVIFLIVMVTFAVIDCVAVVAMYNLPESKPIPKILLGIIKSRWMGYLLLERLDEATAERRASLDDLILDTAKIPECSQTPRGSQNGGKPCATGGANSMTAKEEFARELDLQQSEGWKLSANFVDRLFGICYSVALVTGTVYYLCQAKYSQ